MKRGGDGRKEGIYPPDYVFLGTIKRGLHLLRTQEFGMQGKGESGTEMYWEMKESGPRSQWCCRQCLE